MEKEFVSYEIALALKELGFDEPCFGYYDIDKGYSNGYAFCYSDVKSQFKNGCSAPLYQQVFRWFLKKHNLYAVIIPTITMYWTFVTMTVVEDMVEVPPYNNVKAYDYSIKEEAELACLLKLIELVKNK